MSARATPPFRADQVGSLLRPTEIKEARAKLERGEIDAGELRAVEDRCIRNAVARQESLKTHITDAMKIYERDILKDVTWHPLSRQNRNTRSRATISHRSTSRPSSMT